MITSIEINFVHKRWKVEFLAYGLRFMLLLFLDILQQPKLFFLLKRIKKAKEMINNFKKIIYHECLFVSFMASIKTSFCRLSSLRTNLSSFL